MFSFVSSRAETLTEPIVITWHEMYMLWVSLLCVTTPPSTGHENPGSKMWFSLTYTTSDSTVRCGNDDCFHWCSSGYSHSATFDFSPVDAGGGFGLGFIYSSWPGYYMFHWCNVPHNCHMWCQTPNLPLVLSSPAKMWACWVVCGWLLVTKKLVPSAQLQMKGPLVVPADLAALEKLLNRSQDWNNLPC